MSDSNPMTGPPILNLHDPKAAQPRDELLQSVREADREEHARMQYLAGLAAPGMVQQLRVLTDIAIILSGWASVTLEVFLRRQFGERYFTPLRHFLGLMVLLVFGSGVSLFTMLTLSGAAPQQAARALFSSSVLGWFAVAYFIAGLIHRFDIWYRNHYEDRLWYSKSFGISWLNFLVGFRLGPLPPLDDWFIYLYVEPGACFLAGWLLWILGTTDVEPTGPLGSWFMLASFALFAKNQMLYYKERDKFLNMNDSRIEAMYLIASTRGAPKEETAGYVVVSLPQSLDRDRDGVLDMLAQSALPVSAAATDAAPDIQARLAATLRPAQPASSPGDGQEGRP